MNPHRSSQAACNWLCCSIEVSPCHCNTAVGGVFFGRTTRPCRTHWSHSLAPTPAIAIPVICSPCRPTSIARPMTSDTPRNPMDKMAQWLEEIQSQYIAPNYCSGVRLVPVCHPPLLVSLVSSTCRDTPHAFFCVHWFCGSSSLCLPCAATLPLLRRRTMPNYGSWVPPAILACQIGYIPGCVKCVQKHVHITQTNVIGSLCKSLYFDALNSSACGSRCGW